MHLSSALALAIGAGAGVATGVAISIDTAVASDTPFPMPLCKGVDIEDATIVQLQNLMTVGALTSQDLVECYIARIYQTNSTLHSISEVNPDAASIASSLDRERRNQTTRGLLHGIPFLVKDNIYTADAHNTSEGGLVLLGGRYVREATVVTRLRAAGAVLLGHTSLSEAADHRALTNFSDGYSARVGQIRNPYNLSQPTSGSSGGSVVAVRANQVPVALGTETHGSLVHPASNLGLYTLKSTPGLMSRHGIIPGSFYHDTPGPFARSVEDVAIMLDAMVGPDQYDNGTFEALGRYPEKGYRAEVVGKESLKGMKLGLPWNPYWSTSGNINSPGQRPLYEGRLKELEAAGAEIYNISYIPHIATIANPYGFGQPSTIPDKYNHLTAYYTLLAVAYGEWLTEWTFPVTDPRHGAAMTSLDDMIAWNAAHNSSTGALGNGTWWYNTQTGQDFYESAAATNGSLDGEAFQTAFGWGRRTAREAIDGGHAYVTENGTVIELDGLLVPGDRSGGHDNACASVPSYAGYPVATVPVGQSGYALPCGLCVYGRQFGEAKLVRVASAMSDLFRWDESPRFYNLDAQGRWESPWPGYTCSEESLEQYSCEEEG